MWRRDQIHIKESLAQQFFSVQKNERREEANCSQSFAFLRKMSSKIFLILFTVAIFAVHASSAPIGYEDGEEMVKRSLAFDGIEKFLSGD